MYKKNRLNQLLITLIQSVVTANGSRAELPDENQNSEVNQDEETELEDRDMRLLINELDFCLNSHSYSDLELLGLFIKHEREAAGLSRTNLAQRSYLSLEVIMALELALYEKEEIMLEWIDRISYTLDLNYEQLKSLIAMHDSPTEDLPCSDTHNEFYKEIVFSEAHTQFEDGDTIFYEPYQFLIDQLASCLREDEQVRMTQIWLNQQKQKGVYIGQSLIELALSSLPKRPRSLGNHVTPIQTKKIRIDQAAYTDPYQILVSWISYHKDYQDLITIINYNRDMDVSIGEMLLAWSRNALEIKPIIHRYKPEKRSIFNRLFGHADNPLGLSNSDIDHLKNKTLNDARLND